MKKIDCKVEEKSEEKPTSKYKFKLGDKVLFCNDEYVIDEVEPEDYDGSLPYHLIKESGGVWASEYDLTLINNKEEN